MLSVKFFVRDLSLSPSVIAPLPPARIHRARHRGRRIGIKKPQRRRKAGQQSQYRPSESQR